MSSRTRMFIAALTAGFRSRTVGEPHDRHRRRADDRFARAHKIGQS